MTETTHLGLPYLAAAQAQKHVTHNEALTPARRGGAARRHRHDADRAAGKPGRGRPVHRRRGRDRRVGRARRRDRGLRRRRVDAHRGRAGVDRLRHGGRGGAGAARRRLGRGRELPRRGGPVRGERDGRRDQPARGAVQRRALHRRRRRRTAAPATCGSWSTRRPTADTASLLFQSGFSGGPRSGSPATPTSSSRSRRTARHGRRRSGSTRTPGSPPSSTTMCVSGLAATTVQEAIDEVAASGGGGAVASVFGRTGTVVAATSDYDAVEVDFAPAGAIAATNVQGGDRGARRGEARQGRRHDDRLSSRSTPTPMPR